MAGEAKRHAVEPHHAPAEGECRCVRRKPRGELRFQRDHPQSSLISTNVTFGISPARNAASDNCSRSSAKRTGTSKRNPALTRTEEHTSELQSLMRSSYPVLCLQKKNPNYSTDRHNIVHSNK